MDARRTLDILDLTLLLSSMPVLSAMRILPGRCFLCFFSGSPLFFYGFPSVSIVFVLFSGTAMLLVLEQYLDIISMLGPSIYIVQCNIMLGC